MGTDSLCTIIGGSSRNLFFPDAKSMVMDRQLHSDSGDDIFLCFVQNQSSKAGAPFSILCRPHKFSLKQSRLSSLTGLSGRMPVGQNSAGTRSSKGSRLFLQV